MPEYLELDLSGAALRVRLADVGEVPLTGAPDDGGLPTEFGVPGPVSSGGGRAAALAADTLRATLRPLGPLLDQVHASVAGAEHPPELAAADAFNLRPDETMLVAAHTRDLVAAANTGLQTAHIARPNEQVRTLLELTSLDQVLRTHASIEALSCHPMAALAEH